MEENGLYIWGLHVTVLSLESRLEVGVTSNREDLAAGVRNTFVAIERSDGISEDGMDVGIESESKGRGLYLHLLENTRGADEADLDR